MTQQLSIKKPSGRIGEFSHLIMQKVYAAAGGAPGGIPSGFPDGRFPRCETPGH
jgi:hypothetical protein